MSNLPAVQQNAIELALIGGDLSKMAAPERLAYYKQLCESLSLNPLTQPFKYMVLNGSLQLYATKGAAEQLRQIHDVSVTDLETQVTEGVYIVRAKGKNGKGRVDASTGAVTIGGLRGEQLANAIMKAETKAKRRLTLSICGLNMLDETEVETVAGAKADVVDTRTGEIIPTKTLPTADEVEGQKKAEENPQPSIPQATDHSPDEILGIGKKYPNHKWRDLPQDYLEWMHSDRAKVDIRFKTRALKELDRRAADQSAAVQEAMGDDNYTGDYSAFDDKAEAGL